MIMMNNNLKNMLVGVLLVVGCLQTMALDVNYKLSLKQPGNDAVTYPLKKTGDQLTAAKRQLKGQIAIACDNREQFALDIAKNYLHYGQVRDIEDLLQRIDAISPAQIQDVAQYVFAPDHLQTLIL